MNMPDQILKKKSASLQKGLDVFGAVLYTLTLPILWFVAGFAATELGNRGAGALVIGLQYALGVTILLGIVSVWYSVVADSRPAVMRIAQWAPWLMLVVLLISLLLI